MLISLVEAPTCRCGSPMRFVMHGPTQILWECPECGRLLWQRQGRDDQWYVSADPADLD